MAKTTFLNCSNTFFSRKILEKYRMGKRGRFRFPVMILRKNANYYLPQKINLNVFLQFYFHNHPLSSLNFLGVQNLKELLKDALRIKEPAHMLKKIGDGFNVVLMNMVRHCFTMTPLSILSGNSGYWNSKFSSNMKFMESGDVIYPQISKQVPSINDVQINFRTQRIKTPPGGTEKRLIILDNAPKEGKKEAIGFINTWIDRKISNRNKLTYKQSFSRIQDSRVIHSVFGNKCPAILFERDCSRNNNFRHTYTKSFYSVSHGGIVDRFLSLVNYIQVNNPRMHEAGSDRKEDAGKHSPTSTILFNNDLMRNSFLKFDSYQRSINVLPGIAKMFYDQDNLQIINPQVEGTRNYFEQANVQNIRLSQNKGTYQYSLMHGFPLNIMQTSLMPGPTTSKMVQLQIRKNMKSSDNDIQNVFTISKPFMKNIGYTFLDSLNSSFGKKGISFMMKNEKYIFHKTRKIEREVDDLKKMVIETKNTLAEKSTLIPLKNAGKTNFDINRIADQVYQNIERRIRIERERKGL